MPRRVEQVALPSHEALVGRSKLIQAHLDAFAVEHRDEPLAWCQMSQFVSMAHTRATERHRVPREPPSEKIERWTQRSSDGNARVGEVSSCLLGGDYLFIGPSANHGLAQSHLRERFAPVRPPATAIAPSRRRRRELSRRAVLVAGEFIASARDQELEIPFDASFIYKDFLKTARLLGAWESFFAGESPRAAVWPEARGTQPFVHAAREAGVPTIYLPHAPQLADVRRRGGLPWDYAGLRGPEEAAYVAALGVDCERLNVVGNPSIEPDLAPEIDPQLPLVFAPTKEKRREHLLVPLVKLIHAVVGDNVVVGRHPAARNGGASHFPPGWHVWDGGRTYDLLRQGPPVVLQHSSGVALEALHLGIPVIELSYPGRTPSYPFIREPYVYFASTSRELVTAIGKATADARDPARRRELSEWARGWNSPTGAESGERAIALVELAAAAGPRGPIWETRG